MHIHLPKHSWKLLKGYSFLEVGLVLFLSSLFVGIYLNSVPDFQRWVQRFQKYFRFEEQYILFSIQLEEDFYLADLSDEGKIQALKDDLIFERTLLSGSTSEEVSYQYSWNSSRQAIFKKKGSRHDEVLREVSQFQYFVTEPPQVLCLHLQIQNIYEESVFENKMCRRLF